MALEAAETEARVAWNKLRAELRWKEPSAPAEKSAALESAYSLDSAGDDNGVGGRRIGRRVSGVADLDDIIIESPGEFLEQRRNSVVWGTPARASAGAALGSWSPFATDGRRAASSSGVLG